MDRRAMLSRGSSSPLRERIGAGLLAALLQLGMVMVLLRGFAPDFSHVIAGRVSAALTVTVTPEPLPSPQPTARRTAEASGLAAAAGRKAVPRAVSAPLPRIAIARPQSAPPVASTGNADSSGARDVGTASGAGGAGNGTGSGAAGNGQGAGGGSHAVKIAGDINSARDYPRESRDLRIGDHVIIYLTVGTDGRGKACRVFRPSRDAAADRITCALAMQRFRFHPATDAAGNPVESTFGWQQRWFY